MNFANIFSSEIIKFNKNMIRKTNSSISIIYLESGRYINFIQTLQRRAGDLELLPTGDLSEFRNEIEAENQDYIRHLSQRYNIYIKYIIGSTKKIIEKSINTRNYELSVSVTLKLLNKIFEDGENHYDIKVFTAFRDPDTYNEGTREIGKRDYTINGNIDFAMCLIKEYYIKNNARKGDGDYANEHTDFDQYYNCTITVPIYSNYSGKKRYFGYLCCDVLNEKYGDAEIFTINESHLLSSSAFNLSLFLDTINSSWKNMIEHNDFFNAHIHGEFIEKRNI